MYDAFPDSGVVAPIEQPRVLDIQFTGTASEYFRVWAVNLCLTLLTLGIYSAWAKVRKKRYIYSHTLLDGTPFQYLAQPIPILKGRLIAAVLLVTYYFASNIFLAALPYVLVLGLVLAPWVIVRSAAFNARYTAWRNLTFRFDGTYWDSFKVVHWLGILPVFVLGGLFEFGGSPLIAGGVTLTAVALFPFWLRRLKALIVTHTLYGGQRGEFSAAGGAFFRIYFVGFLFLMLMVIVLSFYFSMFVWGRGLEADSASIFAFLVPVYLVYAIGYAYVQANTSNLVWNRTRLGPVFFKSTLPTWGLTGLYVTNALAILFSLGLAIPWAVIRTLKFRVDHLESDSDGGLRQFQGSEEDRVAAAGAEIGEFFDLDLSL